jgi:hypothetical protein
MATLLADQRLPIIEGIALLAVCAALILAPVARTRSRRSGDRVAQVFWGDVGQAGYIWAGATTILLVSALLEVEGILTLIWLVLALTVGLVCIVIVRLRWRRLGLVSERTQTDDLSWPDRPQLVSTTWKVAILGAGGGGLVVYMVSVSHSWGHPIPWLEAGLGVVVGYVVGLIIATPRYTLKRIS